MNRFRSIGAALRKQGASLFSPEHIQRNRTAQFLGGSPDKSAERVLWNPLRGPVRLRTLTTLRWLAVIGQTTAIALVHFGLGYEVPLSICVGIIAASVWLNLFVMLRFSSQRYLGDTEAALHIAFDICQLCMLLFFTGGLQNPFAVLILAPVTIAASVLSLRHTIAIVFLALILVAIVGYFHWPLPWADKNSFAVPPVFIAGVWTALSFSVVFFSIYAHRIAAESAQMRSALIATQMVLSREERLSALGGLAAAAAHELGTPLATIQLTAQEISEELRGGLKKGETLDQELLREDAELMISQVRRCRDILGRLSLRGDEGDVMHDRIGLDSLLREAAAPFVEMSNSPQMIFDVDFDGTLPAPPMMVRRPEIIYGLRNIIENAASYASTTVVMSARWYDDRMSIVILDDGPGFSPEVLGRLGEPYVNSKPSSSRTKIKNTEIIYKKTDHEQQDHGMGLGFFIAKTLLERTQASIDFGNIMRETEALTGESAFIEEIVSDIIEDGLSRKSGVYGAMVRAVWPVAAIIEGANTD